jgi:hypothetical protein
MRTCGACTLCCKLVPVVEVDKGAGERCKFQSFKGCKVYHTQILRDPGVARTIERELGLPADTMPACCQLWTCRWLAGDDTAGLSRPDRSGYVIDVMPDYITVIDHESGRRHDRQSVQIWVDPKRRGAHRDPALRAYLERRAAEGIVALIRYNSADGFVLVAPIMNGGRGWLEIETNMKSTTHTWADIAEALGSVSVVLEMEGGA